MKKLKICILVFLGYCSNISAQTLQQCTTDNNNDGVTNTTDFLNLVGQFGQNCEPLGTVSSFTCSDFINSGTLTQGNEASNVSSIISYTGGNGGDHNGQVVSSTGVTGLYAALQAGSFNSGAGNLTYIILGTPATSGTASFAINIGGQTCTLTRTVAGSNPTNSTAHSCGAANVHNSAKSYGTLTDQQGNVYKTIVIGNQEWMAENLKTSVYRNGEAIPNVIDDYQWYTLNSGAWCYFNNDITFECPYGKQYNWYAVADPRNVCPAGWHVPTDNEWISLTAYLGGEAVAGGKMKSAGFQNWSSPNTSATNESGFSGLPGSYRSGGSFTINDLGESSLWWSSTSNEYSNNSAWATNLLFFNDDAARSDGNNKERGFYVRCIRDASSQGSINGINCISANNSGSLSQGTASVSVPYSGGNGGTHSGQTVSSIGVTGLTATLAAGNFMNGSGNLIYTITGQPATSGIAIFNLNIGGQSCTINVTVNPFGIYTGTPASCGASNIHNPAKTYGTLTDQQGNTYKTIVIGSQEWMAENLKTIIYSNGDSIINVADSAWGSLTTGAWTYYENNSSYDCPYGKLYNWYAVADARNVCPTGWHVPSDADWSVLVNYFDQGANGGDIFPNIAGGKLKSAGFQYWIDPNGEATNESGFSGLPGGSRYIDNTFSGVGFTGLWWSSSESVLSVAFLRALNYYFGDANKTEEYKATGLSVRCIKD